MYTTRHCEFAQPKIIIKNVLLMSRSIHMINNFNFGCALYFLLTDLERMLTIIRNRDIYL